MLNPKLHLNPKLFDEDVEKLPTRNGFGTGLVAAGDKDPHVMVLTADLNESTRCDAFAKNYPERFVECGVAEQNMAAIAAGLGVTGKVPFISSYATFSPGKNWETIRTTIVYNEANVKIAGHHAGIMTGPDGATHQATEDIASMRCLPMLQIMIGCDAIEAEKTTIKAAEIVGPVYLRYTRDKTPVMTTKETPFHFGKLQTFWVTEKPQATIIATGYMLYYAMKAAKSLEEKGINVLVANAATIKPFDEEGLVTLAKETGAIVTVEDHQVMGGLGGLIAEVLAKHHPTPMEFIGLQNTFGESGKPQVLIEKYHMGENAIMEAVEKVIKRK